MTKTSGKSQWERPFNSPLECGFRSLVLLVEAHPNSLDLQRLLQYDYLLVHSGDVAGGPSSLHPETPLRSSELLVRRELVMQGVRLMGSKGFVRALYEKKGILYAASDAALPFLDQFDGRYIHDLRRVASWVVREFSGYSDKKLSGFMRKNWDRWGAEFSREYTLLELPG